MREYKIEKPVDRETFERQVMLYASGRYTLGECAAACGISRTWFTLRLKQYMDPEKYGELPEGFYADGLDPKARALDAGGSYSKKSPLEKMRMTVLDASKLPEAWDDG